MAELQTEVSAWQTIMKVPDDYGGIRSAAKARQATQMRRVEKNLKIHNKVEEAIRSRKTYEEVRDLVRRSGAVCTVKGKKVVVETGGVEQQLDNNVSYRNQANIDMYSSTNMKKREENRKHPEIVKAIDGFWGIMPKTTKGNVNKSMYKWFSRKLFFALVPNATEQEFERTVYEDWKNDACYSHVMTQRSFRSAVYNLADLWCETVDPLEYRDFLNRCRKIVEAGAPFKGRTDEEREATTDAPSGALRSSQTGASSKALKGAKNKGRRINQDLLLLTESCAELQQGDLVEGDVDPESVQGLRIAGQYLLDEIIETSVMHTRASMQVLLDIQGEETEDAEGDIIQVMHNLQDRRFALCEDTGDASFQMEAGFMKGVEEALSDRADARLLISDECDLLTKSESFQAPGNLPLWKQKQTERKGAMEKTRDRHMGMLRDTLLADSNRLKGCYQAILKLDLDLSKQLKGRHHPAFALIHTQLTTMTKDLTRTRDAAEEETEEMLLAFVALTGDILQLRRYAESTIEILPTRVIYEEFFEDDDPEKSDVRHPKWGNSRFKRGVEWFWTFCESRSDIIGDMLEEVGDSVAQLQTHSTKLLHSMHRLLMELETNEIAVLAKDEYLPTKDKLEVVTELQEEKKKNGEARKEQSAELTGLHEEWQTVLSTFKTGNLERIELEKELTANLSEARSLGEAFEFAKPLVALYKKQANGMEDMLEETMKPSTTPPPSPSTTSLQPSNVDLLPEVGDDELPPDVMEPLDFLTYLGELSVQWFLRWRVVFNRTRYTFYYQKNEFYNQVHAQHLKAMSKHTVTAASYSVKMVEEIKNILADHTRSKDFSEEQMVVMQDMLAQEEDIKKLETEAATAQTEREEDINSQLKIASGKCERRHNRYLRVLSEQNSVLMRVAVFVKDLVGHDRRLISRFLEEWSDVENDARKASQAAQHRRRKEEDRIAKEHAAAEQRRQKQEEDRPQRVLKAEKEQKEIIERKKQQERDRLSTRQKRLEERERLQKEREQREAEEKKKWRQQFLEDEKLRKREEQERRGLELQRMQAAQAASKKKTQASPTQPGVPKTPQSKNLDAPKRVVRRKSGPATATPTYKPDVDGDAKKVLTTQKNVKRVRAPSQRIKQAIEQEIASFSELNTQSMQMNLEEFENRRTEYFAEAASNAAIYALECTRLRCPISPAVSTLLSNAELQFTMNNLLLSRKSVNLYSILDVVRLNPLQYLELAGIKPGLDKDSIKKLCQAVIGHQFLQMIDIRDNPNVGPHGGQALLTLVKDNPHLARIKMDGSNIPGEIQAEIDKVCDAHRFCSTIGRAEFMYIKTVFDEIDRDQSGVVDMAELSLYNNAHAALIGTRSQQAFGSSPTMGTLGSATGSSNLVASMQDRQTTRVDHVRDVLLRLESDSQTTYFTLPQLLSHIYPTWPIEELQLLTARYLDDSENGASLEEMQQFMEQFGTNGTLTLHQLAKGLGEADVESLRAAFQECDLDNDGFLSIDEFMSFVGA